MYGTIDNISYWQHLLLTNKSRHFWYRWAKMYNGHIVIPMWHDLSTNDSANVSSPFIPKSSLQTLTHQPITAVQ